MSCLSDYGNAFVNCLYFDFKQTQWCYDSCWTAKWHSGMELAQYREKVFTFSPVEMSILYFC